MGSAAGFQAVIVPSSLAQMKIAGTVTPFALIVRPVVGFQTMPVGAAAGGAIRPGGSGILTVRPCFTPSPS
jgi:hypothetical protein